MTRAPEPTREDLARWRRLIAEAARSAAEPAASVGDLAAACKAARKAIVPGVLDKSNPFVRLVRTAQQFEAATIGQRRELADQMNARALACRQLLDGPPPQRLPYAED